MHGLRKYLVTKKKPDTHCTISEDISVPGPSQPFEDCVIPQTSKPSPEIHDSSAEETESSEEVEPLPKEMQPPRSKKNVSH